MYHYPLLVDGSGALGVAYPIGLLSSCASAAGSGRVKG